jgi:hypothetical protein
VEGVLVRLLGRPVRCAACGGELFRGFPVVWRGELWLIGTYGHEVATAFTSSETIEFRHAQLDECPTPQPGWVE